MLVLRGIDGWMGWSFYLCFLIVMEGRLRDYVHDMLERLVMGRGCLVE